MKVNFNVEGKKIQILYILWVLENYSDENTKLSQEDIVRILAEKEQKIERKAVANALLQLIAYGYNIHGVIPELDDDGNELPRSRKGIWLERDIADEKLFWLMDSIKYNAFMDQKQKKEFIESIISLGSKSFKEKNNASTIIDGGRIFHVEGASLFKQLSEIDKAIELGKKIRFTYSKLKRKGNKFVYEDGKLYTVSPYWVVVNKGNTYLICYNHGENKLWHCRVDKMKNVETIKSFALPRTETELKGVDVGDYVTKHPLMFSSDVVPVELKMDKNQIIRLVEAFGANFTTLTETEEYLTVKVCAGELDMFHWAIQYGRFVEVLSPQSLRDSIRNHIEGMALKYVSGDGDRYTEAIKQVKANATLDLTGIKIGHRKKHEELENVRRLTLSDNRITDISFLRNYKKLNTLNIANNSISDISVLAELDTVHTVRLENLPIKDLSPLAKMKGLKYLHLSLGRTVDYSAINNIAGLQALSLPENDSYYLDWAYIEKNRKDLEVRRIRYSPKDLPKIGGNLTSPYPLIVIKEALGYNNKLIKSQEEALLDVEKMLNSLPEEEKEVAYLLYKNDYNYPAISEKLNVSVDEVGRIHKSIKKKITHPSYNSGLVKLVEVADPNSNDAIQKLKEMIRDNK